MKNLWKHIRTVQQHRKIVRQECRACGLIWQGLIHDLSKFSPTEFLTSVKYYQGNRSPIDAEREDIGYSLVWLHHKGRNKHHWEYWIDYGKNGEVIANKMPSKYVIEFICDSIAAGKVYTGDKWTENSPMEFFKKARPGRHLHPDTEKLMIGLLTIIATDGLHGFHRVCRTRYKILGDHARTTRHPLFEEYGT